MFSLIFLKCVPTPERLRATLRLSPTSSIAMEYGAWWSEVERKAVVSLRRELLRHDFKYRLQEAQYELVRRRDVLRGQGIGPGDPRYPDIFDVVGDDTIRYGSR
jgi:hypothetical protein